MAWTSGEAVADRALKLVGAPCHFPAASATPMLPQRSVTMLQLLGAALGIPAAAAGCYSAYQTYFSTEAVCQRLRTAIVITMERKLASDAKKTLLRRDVAEFDKTCGDSDPDARTVFQAKQDWKTVLDPISVDEVKRTGRDLTLVVVYSQGPVKGLSRYFSNVRGGQKPRTTKLDPADQSQRQHYERELQNVFAAYATVSC